MEWDFMALMWTSPFASVTLPQRDRSSKRKLLVPGTRLPLFLSTPVPVRVARLRFGFRRASNKPADSYYWILNVLHQPR